MSERRPFLPYSCPQVSEADIAAVTEALKDPIISQGKRLESFERAFADYVGAKHAVAFSSGTAALHGMCVVANFREGDEIIVPALTFVGTANAVSYTGAAPVFCDVSDRTLCIDPARAADAVTPATRAILAVDFAGHSCDYDALEALCEQYGLMLLVDAAHAPGARYGRRAVGSIGRMAAFSFNPVKNFTAAEGGMVTTSSDADAALLRQFRNNGLTRDPKFLTRPPPAGWYYEQHVLGFNYKLSELHAALGLSQLQRLDAFNSTRRSLASLYHTALAALPLKLPSEVPPAHHVYHLYPVRLTRDARMPRDELFEALRADGLGVQLHYMPVPALPHYSQRGYDASRYPVAMEYYVGAFSIPLHHGMTEADARRVIEALHIYLG